MWVKLGGNETLEFNMFIKYFLSNSFEMNFYGVVKQYITKFCRGLQCYLELHLKYF